VFIPLLSNFNSSSFIGQVHSRSHFTRIDQALLFGPQYIPAAAAYTTYPSHSELAPFSVKILTKLSLSILPSTLATLIERSVESERILAGFTQIISTESMGDVTLAEEFAEQATGAGAPSMDGESGSLEQASRLAALDLLIQDTELNRPFPNVAHFLLFGGKVGDQTRQDPHALGARKTSIHILLVPVLVNTGIPRLRGKQKEKGKIEPPVDPLFITLPGLAERCYRVFYQLCIHPRTSDFTTRYLGIMMITVTVGHMSQCTSHVEHCQWQRRGELQALSFKLQVLPGPSGADSPFSFMSPFSTSLVFGVLLHENFAKPRLLATRRYLGLFRCLTES
jgi:nuclear pore complex protein Nup205